MSNITQLPPRGALFQAALATLGGDVDPLARITRLRDAFPQASHAAIARQVRETACLFHVNGIKPVVAK